MRDNCARLSALVINTPISDTGFDVTPALLCLRLLIQQGFSFLLHGRSGGGRNSRGGLHSQYKNFICQYLQWMERKRVLVDYHNFEVDCVSAAGLHALYSQINDEWEKNLLCPWSGLYASLPLSLTYLANRFVGVRPYSNLAWRLLVTKRVSLITV